MARGTRGYARSEDAAGARKTASEVSERAVFSIDVCCCASAMRSAQMRAPRRARQRTAHARTMRCRLFIDQEIRLPTNPSSATPRPMHQPPPSPAVCCRDVIFAKPLFRHYDVYFATSLRYAPRCSAVCHVADVHRCHADDIDTLLRVR